MAAYNSAGSAWADYQSVTTSATSVTLDHPAAARAYAPARGSLFGANGPSFLDVQQGQEGDCWMLASLAAFLGATMVWVAVLNRHFRR